MIVFLSLEAVNLHPPLHTPLCEQSIADVQSVGLFGKLPL